MPETELSVEEVNRIIHTEIMGEACKHTTLPVQNGIARCPLCGMNAFADQPYDMQKFENWRVPDYCSPKSPRELLDGAVAKVVEKVGFLVYGQWLAFTFYDAGLMPKAENVEDVDAVLTAFGIAGTATPEQIARALVAAYQCVREGE